MAPGNPSAIHPTGQRILWLVFVVNVILEAVWIVCCDHLLVGLGANGCPGVFGRGNKFTVSSRNPSTPRSATTVQCPRLLSERPHSGSSDRSCAESCGDSIVGEPVHRSMQGHRIQTTSCWWITISLASAQTAVLRSLSLLFLASKNHG